MAVEKEDVTLVAMVRLDVPGKHNLVGVIRQDVLPAFRLERDGRTKEDIGEMLDGDKFFEILRRRDTIVFGAVEHRSEFDPAALDQFNDGSGQVAFVLIGGLDRGLADCLQVLLAGRSLFTALGDISR